MTPDELAEIEDIAVHEGRLSLPWVRRLIAEVERLWAERDQALDEAEAATRELLNSRWKS